MVTTKRQTAGIAIHYTPEFKEDAIRYADYYGITYDTLDGWTKDDCRKKRTGDGEPINDKLRDEETIALRKKLQDTRNTLEIFKTSKDS